MLPKKTSLLHQADQKQVQEPSTPAFAEIDHYQSFGYRWGKDLRHRPPPPGWRRAFHRFAALADPEAGGSGRIFLRCPSSCTGSSRAPTGQMRGIS